MKIFATLCTLTIAICGALTAQSPDRMTVKFPTAVVVNGVTLPAGATTIDVLHNAGATMLAFHSDSGGNSTVFVNRLINTATENEPRVILDHTGSTYRLNRILLTDHTALQVLDPQ